MAVLSHQNLVKITRGRRPIISGVRPICDDQIQMASIDLTLAGPVYGMRASGVPRAGQPVRDCIDAGSKHSFSLSDHEDKLLYRLQTYIIPLNECLQLPKGYSVRFSPKSSTGRVDVLTRILVDGVPHFDTIPPGGYRGRLYLEITPLSCDVLVRAGQALIQMRLRHGEDFLTEKDLRECQAEHGIVWGKNGNPLEPDTLTLGAHGIYMHVDLDRTVVGFEAHDPIRGELSFAKKDAHTSDQFFAPILRPKDGSFILNPGKFYLLATKERVKIPPHICGDIAAYDASTGELRSHYAGFFDPGFGGSRPEDTGTVGVMEVRGRELPFVLQDGQPICRMDFELVDAIPDVLYGTTGVNHYTGSGPSLGKFFRDRQEVWKE